MKELHEVDRIVCEVITDEEFDKLQKDDYDRWDLDRRTAKNGRARLIRRLAKYGLTVDEWDEWTA